MTALCLVAGRVKVSWRRGDGTRVRRCRKRRRRRVSVDGDGVLKVLRSRRRDAGLFICHATTTDITITDTTSGTDHRRDRRLLGSANTTLSFHKPHNALRLIQTRSSLCLSQSSNDN